MAVKQDEKEPLRLKPYTFIGFSPNGVRGKEHFGDCPLCGKENKFHVNEDTGKFICYSGRCQQQGNVYTFIKLWYEKVAEDNANPKAFRSEWNALVENRSLDENELRKAGIVWSAEKERWVIPNYNRDGKLIYLRFYQLGRAVIGCAKGEDLEPGLFGIEDLTDVSRKKEPVYICEGEWDVIALRSFLKHARKPGVVVGVPGANVFKDTWVELFLDRTVILAYDNDGGGVRGKRRANGKLARVAKTVKMIRWPDTLPENYDCRDFVKDGGTYNALRDLTVDYEDTEQLTTTETEEAEVIYEELPLLAESKRPLLSDVIKVYEQWLDLSQDMKDGIRVVFAVVLTTQLDGEPLWVHIVGPPGSGKTEIVMSVSECRQVVSKSTLTAHTLVSGFQAAGNRDPSLIPHLLGKCFVLKDFTEILAMHKANKDEIYSILRGAYDGRVEKPFGNGINREYKGFFNMLSGVTHSIFGERGTSLGERFLTFHMIKGVGFDSSKVIEAALDNLQAESGMREALSNAAKSFLEFRITKEDTPPLPALYKKRITALAQLVSMLRATVERDSRSRDSDKLAFRPQHEVGTRLAKQLAKLLMGLGLQHDPIGITDDDYRIVARVALDSCNNWNLSALQELAKIDGQTCQQISDSAGIPKSTARDQLDELTLLGVVRKEKIERDGEQGRCKIKYWITDIVRQHWENSGLSICPKEPQVSLINGRLKFSTDRVRRPKLRAKSSNRKTKVEA